MEPFLNNMNARRLIPCIYTSDGQQGLPGSGHVLDYGQALAQAVEYESGGADEIIFMDVTPHTERRKNLPRFLKDVAATLRVPFVFGGGVYTTGDVEELLKAGAPRIYVNTAAVRNPELINKISVQYGKEALLVAIDTRMSFGKWKVYLNGGKSRTEIDLLSWVKMVELKGAGELLVSTVSHHGQTEETVYQVLQEITSSVTSLPLLVSTGIKEKEDLVSLFRIEGIKGIVSGSFYGKYPDSLRELKLFLEATV